MYVCCILIFSITKMSDVVFGFFATVAFIVIVLFDVAIVTPYWVTVEDSTTNSTRSCTYGLFYSLDCPGNKTVFDNLAIGLNIATSLCPTIFPFFWSCIRCIICCRSSKGNENKRTCTDSCCKWNSLPYTLAGLLGFASVLTVVVKFGLKQLRWSFYLTVASTSVILVQYILYGYETQMKNAQYFLSIDDDIHLKEEQTTLKD